MLAFLKMSLSFYTAMVFLSSPSAVSTSVVSLSLRFSGRMTSLPPYSILLHRSANLALSAKYSFAIESFALNPSPPVLLCEQENLVPMRVQWYNLQSTHILSLFNVYSLYTVHPPFDYIFCILSTYGISIFLLLIGN